MSPPVRPRWEINPQMGRPRRVDDRQIILALRQGPATIRSLARRLGMERSALYYRLRCLEAGGQVGRDRCLPHGGDLLAEAW